ncbi:AfsR/SARP family transcriptional regulator [Streptomyces sp. Tu 3180]|uniref:AfsR/SARP family transcriptional regulator n=1 Tax=Streptomyces sp. Tu 3180 TaxID=2682611 RepID=UPI001359BF4C|nr:AfsR/SARP family transcriptional regulator [Streptomyces sp. Tu 3180]KAF3468283.1 AfsR/SARP family transcriptional regulator [Streptomyces sp. Tu 3180]
MNSGVLGPLLLSDAETSLVPSAPKPRQLLAFLMLNAPQMVRVGDCITELWGSAPPRSAMSTLQTYVLHIRQALRGPRVDHSRLLVTRNQGYQLTLETTDYDRFRFTELTERGRAATAAGDHRAASELFTLALAQWRGPALSDVRTGPLSSPHLAELTETRQGVLEQRIEADLALGRHRELVDELSDLTARHPTHENVHAQLMVALYRSGERKRAGDVFHALRQALGDSLGIEPAPRTQRLYQAVLAGSSALDAPVACG